MKLAYLQKYMADSNQILQNDKDHQLLFAGGPEQAYNKSKMADGRHLEKPKTAISRQRFGRLM